MIQRRTLLATAAAGLAMPTIGRAQAGRTYKIGAAVYGLKAEFMQLWVGAIKAHPAVKSGQAAITVFDGQYDALTQSNQFETMVTQRYDAIIFVPIDAAAGAGAVKKAKAANIPVIGSNARVTGDDLTSYVGSDDVRAGTLEAEAVVKGMGGKGNVVIIEGPIGQSAQIERGRGNMQVLAMHPEIKVLEHKTANWSRAEAQSLMENWLTAHPNQINGLIGQNDEMALGALQAVKAAGIDYAKIPTAGIDGVSDAIRAVKANQMVSILQDADAQAQGALDVALRHLVGDSYKPQGAVWTEYAGQMDWGDGTAKIYSVPWTPVTLANADALLAKRAKT